MRKIFTLLLFASLFSCVESNGQINKGALLLGGDISFFKTNEKIGSEEYIANSFYLSPSLGVATKDNSFWGGRLFLGFSKNYPGIINSGNTNVNSFGAGIFHRKYRSIANKFYLFLEGSVSGLYSSTDFDNGPDYYYDQKNISLNANLYPGVSYQISKKLFLETGLRDIIGISYSSERRSEYNFGATVNRRYTSFSVTSSLNNFTSSFSVGFRLMLGKNNTKP